MAGHHATSSVSTRDYKIVKDPVHGDIKLDRMCVAIIDTPPFQRLRYIRQLGAASYVYPGGSHSRFEHSLGVCHLAGRLVERLKENQPELNITRDEVLCVKIAGLCHDLGHGPFSHVFDMRFIPKVRPTLKWKHEDASCAMFDHVVDTYLYVDEETKEQLSIVDRKMIKNIIKGKCDDNDRAFLYQIVNNDENGVDVDKWDYFLRDCHHVGIGTDFDPGRLIEASRVIQVDGKQRICWRDKEMFNVHQMFITRYTLHRRVYQHKVIKAVEMMIVEAMEKANKAFRLSDSVSNMDAYSKLTDGVFYEIKRSTDTQLEEAQQLLLNMEKRKLYRCVAESPLIKVKPDCKPPIPQTEEVLMEDLIEKLKKQKPDRTKLDRIRVLVTNFDLGIKKDQRIYQYKKGEDTARPVDHKKVSLLSFPSELYNEVVIRVYLVPPEDYEADTDFDQKIKGTLEQWGEPKWKKQVKELIEKAKKRKLEQEKKAEEERKLEQEKKTEEERKVDQEKKAEEERKLDQEKKAEEERKLEQEKKAEEERKVDQEKKAEEERKLDQEKKAEEEMKRDQEEEKSKRDQEQTTAETPSPGK